MGKENNGNAFGISSRYLLYILFAAISTILNIGTQVLVSQGIIGNAFFGITIVQNISVGLVFKMLVATIVAFIFKFLIDKFLIFKNRASGAGENLRQVIFYGFFAVFTTIIFWGFELIFKFALVFPYSEYLGAVTGLTVGYSVKYLLDSKFVFS
jgi:hypothetical protein